MLKFLSIENIAVIEKCVCTFENGFIVLTGETGAGKSVIINSLSLLAGERASKDLIRTGEQSAKVEGVFDATDEIKRKSLASIDLIQEINSFVNVDLLNP